MADDNATTTTANEVDDDDKKQENEENKKDETKQKDEDSDIPKDLTKTTPQQQRRLMKKIGIPVQKVGEVWYPIDKKWYDSWERYTQWDKGDKDIVGGLDKLHETADPRPGPIDNSQLQDPNNPKALAMNIQENRTHIWIHSDVWTLLQACYTGGPAFPRKVYERGSSYNKEKYICTRPQLVKIVYADDKTGEIDLNKNCVDRGYPPDYTLKQMAKELEDEMEWPEDDKKEDTPYVHIWLPFGKVKAIYPIDKSKAKVSEEELEKEDDKRYVEVPDDYLKTKLDDIFKQPEPVATDPNAADADGDKADDANKEDDRNKDKEDDKETGKEDEATKKTEEKQEEVVIIIERKQPGVDKDKAWPRAKGDDWREKLVTGDIIDVKDEQDKWYETMIRFVYPADGDKAGICIVHYIGWNIKWDEPLKISDEDRLAKRHTHTKGPHRPRKKEYGGGGGYYDNSFSFWQNENGAPEQRGVVGLRNLGNTCFMNSTIQCLAQSPQLTDYFLQNDYIHDVNKNNPLGWGGRVAKAWAILLHDMFSGKYRTVAPRQFKSAIGEVAPRFMGYAQQDSQELLSFLLDGLHEDLNKIKDKPATQGVESKGRPDDVVALEAWQTYLKRNQSVVVDLLQGQYKSEVVCPDCHRVSITFDPYMFLSVPLPTEKYKVIEYTWIDSDTSKPPTIFGQKMLKVADIDMLKTDVAKAQGVPKEELFVCDIWKSKIHRELRRHDSVSDINRKSDDIFIYHSKRPDMEEWKEKTKDLNKEEDKDKAAGDESEDDERAGGGGTDLNASAGNYYANRGGGNRGGKNKAEYQTFVVNNQHRVIVRQQYMHGNQQRHEDEPVGYPLLITLPIKIKITMNQIREVLWKLIKPFLINEELKLNDELPFEFWAAWGFNQHAKIEDSDQIFNLNQRNLKFLIHWSDVKQYKSSLYDTQQRPRDESAPPPIDNNSTSSFLDDDNGSKSLYEVIEYTWIDDTSKPPTIFGQKMLKVADIDMLKDAVAKVQGVPREELFVCEIWKSKIHRELRSNESVSDIDRKSDDIFIYHSKRPDMNKYFASVEDAEKGKTVRVTSFISRLDKQWREAELRANGNKSMYLGAVGRIIAIEEEDDTVLLLWANYDSCWIPIKACADAKDARETVPVFPSHSEADRPAPVDDTTTKAAPTKQADTSDVKEEYFASVADDGVEKGKTVKVTTIISRLEEQCKEAELRVDNKAKYLGVIGKIVMIDAKDDTVNLRWANDDSYWMPIKACVDAKGAKETLPNVMEEYFASAEDDDVEEGKTVKVTMVIARLEEQWKEAELGANDDKSMYLGAVGKIVEIEEDDDTVQLRWANYDTCWIPIKACVDAKGAKETLPVFLSHLAE